MKQFESEDDIGQSYGVEVTKKILSKNIKEEKKMCTGNLKEGSKFPLVKRCNTFSG